MMTITMAGHGLTAPTTKTAESGTSFNTATGELYVTCANHGFVTGDMVKIADNSLVFTCAEDGNSTNHSYPLMYSSLHLQMLLSVVDNIPTFGRVD